MRRDVVVAETWEWRYHGEMSGKELDRGRAKYMKGGRTKAGGICDVGALLLC